MTHQRPQTEKHSHPSLTESPLFWICVFGGMALLGLAIIGPKYAQRHGRLVQQYEARTAAQTRELEPLPIDSATEVGQQQHAVPRPRGGDARPLLIVIGAIVLAAATGLVLQRIRSRNSARTGGAQQTGAPKR
jgi:hypothetical protein